MTFADRVRAVQMFGCSPRQARFLTLVALHGGYSSAGNTSRDRHPER